MSMYGAHSKLKTVELHGKKVKLPATVMTDCTGDPGFTVQADSDEADINKIIARFHKSGQLPPTLRGEPFYGDVSEFGDLQESLIKIQEANDLFMSYPAELRERFENDPVKMVEFLSDESNRKEAEDLGLVVKRPLPPTPEVPSPEKGVESKPK